MHLLNATRQNGTAPFPSGTVSWNFRICMVMYSHVVFSSKKVCCIVSEKQHTYEYTPFIHSSHGARVHKPFMPINLL